MTDPDATEQMPTSEPAGRAVPAAEPYVVVRPWLHGTLYTCSLCGNYPDFPTRELGEAHILAHHSAKE